MVATEGEPVVATEGEPVVAGEATCGNERLLDVV